MNNDHWSRILQIRLRFFLKKFRGWHEISLFTHAINFNTIIITFTTTTTVDIILIMVRIPPGGRQGPAQHPQGWRRVGPLKYCTLLNSDENSDEGWDDDRLYGDGCCSDGSLRSSFRFCDFMVLAMLESDWSYDDDSITKHYSLHDPTNDCLVIGG